MIPLWTEDSNDVIEMKKCHIYALEQCVFCEKNTNTWHLRTNNPICTTCAKSRKVSEIPCDHGKLIRKQMRNKTFDYGDSKRAN